MNFNLAAGWFFEFFEELYHLHNLGKYKSQ